MRRIFTIKSVLLPPVAIGLFAFCIVQGRKAPGSSGSFDVEVKPTGSALAWVMLSAINSCMGKTSTQAVNQTDLARYSRTPQAPFWSQLIALPIGNTLCASLGVFATSATQRAWGGKPIWNPWDLCNEILDRHWGPGARAAIAFCSLGWMLSIFASNLGVNLFPFGADVTALAPRWLNIRRGTYLCYVIALLIQPWQILKSSTTFMRFLGGYSIFLAPLVGIFM
jgi:nucleobase:cation symporter-1, NCS1 family